jgi:hypothetical protein
MLSAYLSVQNKKSGIVKQWRIFCCGEAVRENAVERQATSEIGNVSEEDNLKEDPVHHWTNNRACRVRLAEGDKVSELREPVHHCEHH